jgi:hypothetical protein
MSESSPAVTAKAAVFDVNEGADAVKGYRFPSMPENTLAIDIGGYAKAFESMLGSDDPMLAAAKALGVESPKYTSAKALGTPPTAFNFGRLSYAPDATTNGGVMQWPGINPDSLRKIVRENVAPQLVLGMRVDDVLRYSNHAKHIWKPGWHIEAVDTEDNDKANVKKDIAEATRFIQNSNIETSYTEVRKRDSKRLTGFQKFLAAGTRDWLTFDMLAIWTDMDMKECVKGYALLPAGNIRLCTTAGYENDPDKYAVAVDEGGRVIQAFTRDELTIAVRNPRTDPDVFGYGYPEVEMAMRIIKGFQNAIDLNCDVFDKCHRADTEVLTKEGWKLFGAVDIEKDLFATLNLQHGTFEYQKATAKTWHDYSGDMYRVASRSFDFEVTPNHRIITQYKPSFLIYGETDYTVSTARDLFLQLQGMKKLSRQNYCLPTTSAWEGKEIKTKSFSAYPTHYGRKPRKISGDDYCAFLGMFLSEGSLAKGNSRRLEKISIAQRRASKGFQPFYALIQKVLDAKPQFYAENCFAVNWHGLAEHLRQFGEDCYTKHIPQEILDATPRQQKIFWDYYCLGDGCIQWVKTKNAKRLNRVEHIATTSRLMADQLQELAQKMGYAATISTVNAEKYIVPGRIIKGGTQAIKTSRTRYDIRLKMSKMQAFNLEKTPYTGKIGCVTVPNGTLYVRRNGKAAWSGNSSIAQGILTVSGGAITQRQIDLLTRMFTNMKKGISKWWALPVMGLPDGAKLELLDLTRLKGNESFYNLWMNMLAGALATLWRFPVRRLGYKVSGTARDNEPLPDSSIAAVDEDDPGLAPLLTHWEVVINEYLIATRWPHLRFGFTGKTPKEDARQFAEMKESRTWKEARAENGLPSLETLVQDKDLKKLAKILELTPSDANRSGVFQTLAAQFLKMMFEGSTKDADTPGSAITSRQDSALAQGHGHAAGVRRNSSQEA